MTAGVSRSVLICTQYKSDPSGLGLCWTDRSALQALKMGISLSPRWLRMCDKVREKCAQRTAKNLGLNYCSFIQNMANANHRANGFDTSAASFARWPSMYKGQPTGRPQCMNCPWPCCSLALLEECGFQARNLLHPAASTIKRQSWLWARKLQSPTLNFKYLSILNLPGSVPKEHSTAQAHPPGVDFISY